MMSPIPLPPVCSKRWGHHQMSPRPRGSEEGSFALIRPPLASQTRRLHQGCSNTVDTRLGHVLNSTFLIKRSSFLRQVFFPFICQQKIFFYS